VRDAAATFDTLDTRSRDVGRMLDEAPGTLREGRRVLDHLDRTSDGLERLSRAFKPGAKELRELAPVAARVTDSVAVLAPRFAQLLRTGADTLPSLESFMRRGRADVPVAGRALAGITDAIACVRPYTPELAGYLTGSNGANAGYDANGHYIRLGLTTYPATVPSTMTPWQMTQSFSSVHYAMNRPPGLNVGQPWYQPQCGITPSGLNATGDREGTK
jgi:ABC-type transporter Mla subunit MlaD